MAKTTSYFKAIGVTAGQVYRAKAERGYRYVAIKQVRAGRPSHTPYAFAAEVSKSGAKIYKPRDGMPNVPIKIWLTYNLSSHRWELPSSYELTETVEEEENA